MLFTITKIWEQPKCPSVDEWIKNLWYIYTMEYYSAVKKKKKERKRKRKITILFKLQIVTP